MTPDPWVQEIPAKYKLGDTIQGKVSTITDFGVFIELEDGVEGLIHKSEIEKNPDEKMDDLFKLGAELTARIININPAERKMYLSLKAMSG